MWAQHPSSPALFSEQFETYKILGVCSPGQKHVWRISFFSVPFLASLVAKLRSLPSSQQRRHQNYRVERQHLGLEGSLHLPLPSLQLQLRWKDLVQVSQGVFGWVNVENQGRFTNVRLTKMLDFPKLRMALFFRLLLLLLLSEHHVLHLFSQQPTAPPASFFGYISQAPDNHHQNVNP